MIFKALEYEGEKLYQQESEDDGKLQYGVATEFTRANLHVWDFMMGYEDYKFKTRTGMVFYVLASILINIALLNMVISVVSDTYDRVSMTKKEEEMLAKAEILIDFAALFKCCRPKQHYSEEELDEFGHLYILREVTGVEGDWTGKLNATNDAIKNTKTEIKKEINDFKQQIS